MPFTLPSTPDEALARLLEGNRRFFEERPQTAVPSAERVELDGEYDLSRKEQVAALFGAFRWVSIGSDELEADDLLGSLALAESAAGGRALIMTGDRDMYQCASDSVSLK